MMIKTTCLSANPIHLKGVDLDQQDYESITDALIQLVTPTSLPSSFVVRPTVSPPLLALMNPVLLPCLTTSQTCFAI